MQSARNILLIRPQNFGYNHETAKSNEFQNRAGDTDESAIRQQALAEFERFAETLRSKGVGVFVFDDTDEPAKPDAVFPNNWVSFHADGTVILYPMCATSRRSERRKDIVETLRKDFEIEKIIDLSPYEHESRFLEGTGSIVFDHVNKVAYGCISARTDVGLFNEVSQMLGYTPVTFRAVDIEGRAIYHTNVMMCIGPGFAVVCLESLQYKAEKKQLVETLKAGDLEIVDISFEQINRFSGNMLAVCDNSGNSFLVLSTGALDSFSSEQTSALERYCELLPVSIPTIEKHGGGGARCMMAEIFLPAITNH